MALGIDFNTANSGNGDTLYTAFTKINNMFTTTTKLSNGDLTVGRDGGIKVGKGGGTSYGGTAIGQNALNNSSAGLDNTAVGWSALENSIGNYNTAVGSNAMKDSSGSNANSNTAVGAGVLQPTTGGNNTGVGNVALRNNTSGYENTAIGAGALQANTIGYYNIAIGSGSQNTSTGTNGNTSVGNYSLYNANTGNQNTAFGYGALQNNQSANNSVAVGHVSLQGNTTGQNNTGIGIATLFENQTKSNNTAVGTYALYFNNSLYSNCTGLGYNSNVSADNQIRLGDTAITAVVSQVGSFSDIRDKADVRDTVLGLDFLNSLRPVDYKWDMREDYRTEKPSSLSQDATEEEKNAHKILTDEWLESCKVENITHDGTHTRTRYHHGLIAQEVKSVIEASGVDFGGFQDHTVNGGDEVMTISYMELITPMIKAIQELTARINVLEGN